MKEGAERIFFQGTGPSHSISHRLLVAGFLGISSPFVSLHVASCSCGFLFLGFWASRLPLSPFMWLPVARFLAMSSPFVSLHVASCCRFLGISSPFVSLHVASCCRVARHIVSLCLPLCGFLLPVSGHLVSLCLPSCGFLLPGCAAYRLPLSPVMWLPVAGFLGILSPFDLCLPSCSFLLPASEASRLPLSPFMWLPVHVGFLFMRLPFSGFLGISSPFVSLHVASRCPVSGHVVSLCLPLCLPLSPFMWLPVPSCGFLLPVAGFLAISSPFVSLHVASCCPVSGHLLSLCLPSCGFLLPGSEASCLL